MTLVETLMTQRVTLRTPTGETRDDIGGSVPLYTTLSTYMYLEPTSGTEDATNRNTPIGQWLGVGRLAVEFTSWAQVVCEGQVFDIAAPPRLMYDPDLKAPSHWEMDLQEVT